MKTRSLETVNDYKEKTFKLGYDKRVIKAVNEDCIDTLTNRSNSVTPQLWRSTYTECCKHSLVHGTMVMLSFDYFRNNQRYMTSRYSCAGFIQLKQAQSSSWFHGIYNVCLSKTSQHSYVGPLEVLQYCYLSPLSHHKNDYRLHGK